MELLKNAYALTFFGTYLLRAGSILILVFGLKVLISFYKYNVRLKAFTDSLFDSIDLAGVDDMERLKTLAEIMNPNELDFEANPSPIPEEVIALLKEVKKAKE